MNNILLCIPIESRTSHSVKIKIANSKIDDIYCGTIKHYSYNAQRDKKRKTHHSTLKNEQRTLFSAIKSGTPKNAFYRPAKGLFSEPFY